MNIIQLSACSVPPGSCPVVIGRRGENGVTQVTFDFSTWVSDFGPGAISLLVRRFGDSAIYPVLLAVDGTDAVWTVSATDTDSAGLGAAEYVYTVGQTVKKSAVFPIQVLANIGQPRTTPPDPYISWIEQLLQVAAEVLVNQAAAEQAAADAEAAAGAAEEARDKMPRIVDGTWHVYNAVTESWEDTGIQAEGQDGVGISSAVLNANYTLTLTFTDGSSYTTPPIRGAQGERGPVGATPDISIGTVTTGAAGSQAEATMTGTPERPVLNLTIPRGAPGEVTQAEFDELAGEVADQKSAIESLDALVDRKAGMLVDTASGAIASFVPDATIDHLLGLDVAVEPVQDLHGYDNPWPAGGGKNKAKLSNSNIGNGQRNNVTYSDSGATVSAAGTYSRQGWLIPVVQGQTYTFSFKGVSANNVGNGYQSRCYLADRDAVWGALSDGYISYFQIKTSLASYSYTFTASSNVFFFGVYVTTTATDGSITVSDVQLELGSTATAWAPFENLCAISGWSAVGIEASSINAWDEEWLNGYLGNGGAFIADASSICAKNFITVHPGQTMYVVAQRGTSARICAYAADGTYLERINVANAVYTVPNNAYKIRFSIYGYGTTYNHDVSINYPATDHAYHPYPGNTYTITIGQTVYGGTLDVTGGKMYARPFFPSYNGQTLIGPWISSMDVYAEGTTPTIGAEVVDMGGTPTVYDIDPVQIATIAGQTNNVWADAGDVSVEYAADLKAYIDSKIAALAAQIVNS